MKTAIATLTAIGLLAASAIASERGDDHDEHERESGWRWAFTLDRTKEVRPVTLDAWNDECSSCHYAYPPGLLPGASWTRLLDASALEDHFGENIEMKEALRRELLDYARAGAADQSFTKRSRKIVASIGTAEPPLRISEVPYIRRKHQEIPEAQVKGNPKVNSIAQCDACHTQAKTGNLDDDTVVIPGQGRWRW